MQKINGYTEEEAKELIEFMEEGKKNGQTLTALFEEFGRRQGRARGSVRNYYYALMKSQNDDERVVKLLSGKQLTVGKIRAFTEEECDQAIRSILLEKAKGVSVRKAIFALSGGDDKLTLRLQNKYRNTLKKHPEKIAALERELFGKELPKTRKQGGMSLTNDGGKGGIRGLDAREILQKRLEKEINDLYDRLAQSLREENERLVRENAALRAELQSIKGMLS